MKPKIIDLFSGSLVHSDSFQKGKAAGLWGVIHKASEGITYKDKTYATRRKWATDAGLLWGAYHFNKGDDWKSQLNNFLAAAEPDETTFLVLDFEDYVANMGIHSAVAFMKEAEQRTGKNLGMYSGNRLKETIGQLSKEDVAYLNSKKLWICQYGPRLQLPRGITDWYLWQYTGDGVGPLPHTIDGFENGVDLNVPRIEDFDEFAQKWAD